MFHSGEVPCHPERSRRVIGLEVQLIRYLLDLFRKIEFNI